MPSGNRNGRSQPSRKWKKVARGPLWYGPLFTGCPAVELTIQRLYQADDAEREERFWGLIKSLNYALQVHTDVLVPVRLTIEGSQTDTSWAFHPIPAEKAGGLTWWTLETANHKKVLPAFTKPEEADASPATLGLPVLELPLEQVMQKVLEREDLDSLVLNPWGQSATLDKGILRGLLCAPQPEDGPGEPEVREGRHMASIGRWEEARSCYAEAAEKGCPEGMRRLAGCYENGSGVKRDRRKAMTLWRKAAAAGDVLSQVAIGDRYAAGTTRTPGDPGKALLFYHKAQAMAETEMDITNWPVVCLRIAMAEARATDTERAVRLLAEAAHGLNILYEEEGEGAVRHEMVRAVAGLTQYAKEAFNGVEKVQKLFRDLDARINTESLHFN